MPVSSTCPDEELRHYVERYRRQFSKHKYQYLMIVLVGLILCEGRRTLLGLLRPVAEAISVAGLSRFPVQAAWHEGEIAQQRLSDFRTTMEPVGQAE